MPAHCFDSDNYPCGDPHYRRKALLSGGQRYILRGRICSPETSSQLRTFLFQAHVGYWRAMAECVMPRSRFLVQENRGYSIANSKKNALIVLNYADAWLRKIRCDIPCELRFAMNEYTGKREPTVFIEDRTIVFDQNEDFLSPGYGGVIRFFINSDNVSEMYCKELFRSAKLSAWLIGGMWCAFVGLFLLAMKIG